MKYFVGIDPGKDGAIAVISELGEVRICHFEEGYKEALAKLACDADLRFVYCYMERVHSMPRDGGKSAFAFGQNYGYIQGLLDAYNIPYNTVPPQVWKKAFSLGNNKEDSIKTAHQLFPKVDLRRTERCKTMHDGKAEALLIAEYAYRKHGGR